jgi:hypothetical protein
MTRGDARADARNTGARRRVRDWGKGFLAATALGAIFGLLGPYGTFLNGPAWQRMAYWIGLAWLGYPICAVGITLIMERLRTPRAIWSALAALAVVASVPLAAVSWAAAHALWPLLDHLPWLTPRVWCLECLTTTAIALFAGVARLRWSRAEPPPPAPAAGDLLGCAPKQVHCLQMEDHYVRIHTAGGSRLVLATMAQAVAALAGAPGLRVHRSWWVAGKAVEAAVWDGRNLRLRLVNGMHAPVARAAVVAVRAAGWLDGAPARAPEPASAASGAPGR